MLVEYEDENRPGAGEKAIDNKGGGKGQWKGDGGGKSWGSGKQQGPVKVFFKNLLFETPGGFMMKLFKTFGRVVEFDLWKGPDGRSKGMGTVEFASHAEAREALEQLNGAEVDGRVITCDFDDPSRQESGKGRASDGSGGGGGKGSKGSSSSAGGPCKVFFKNILFETPEDFMHGLFKKFGFVENFNMFRHPDGHPKGMGMVEYRTPNQARDAVTGLHGAEVDGSVITVELEDPDRARSSSSADKGDGKGQAGPGGGTKRAFFKNCLFETTAGFLLKKFKQYGHVVHLDLWVGQEGRSRGMGTVE